MTAGTRQKFGDERTVQLDWREMPPEWARRGVVAVGNFDGVHRGHAELVRQARDLAKTVDGPATLVTFDPHPLKLLAPERFQPPLSTVEDRADRLRKVGADAVVVLTTDADLLHLTPEAFFTTVIQKGFAARGMIEGFNFRFGRDRHGTIETLREFCVQSGMPFRIVEPFLMDDVVVSSSRVRRALESGDVKLAADLLNRPYWISGKVVEGAKRGRTIGFPTANLDQVETLIPAEGVYAVRCRIGEQSWAGAANIGPNPTFGEFARKIEVHLIGYSGDCYGQQLDVEFILRLRETKKFSSVDELVEQMKRDVDVAREAATRRLCAAERFDGEAHGR